MTQPLPAGSPLEASRARPVVAVAWSPAATSPFVVVGAAGDWCELVWLVAESDEATAAYLPLLRRTGTVVDRGDDDLTALAAELAVAGVGGLAVFNDGPIPFAAALADRLDLPFHDVATATRLTDKLAQREALAAAGVASAAYAGIAPGDPPPAGVPLPAVLKPRSGYFSRDVVMVHDAADLAARMAQHHEQPMLLEEFLAPRDGLGEHESGVVSVELVAVDGEVVPLGMTGRFPIAPPFLETGIYHPWEGTGEERERCEEVAVAATRALGVVHGFVHVELKRTPTGPRVVEVNGRLGGLLSQLGQRAGGGDLERQVLRLALGLPLEPLPTPSGVGWLVWGQAEPESTEVVSVTGLDDIADVPGVEQASLDLHPGDAIDVRRGTQAAVFTVEGASPDHAAMLAARRAVLDRVRVVTR